MHSTRCSTCTWKRNNNQKNGAKPWGSTYEANYEAFSQSRRWKTTLATWHSQGLFRLPAELKDKIFLSINKEVKLAHLVHACKFMSIFVEEYRFADVSIGLPSALASFRKSLSSPVVYRRGRTRMQKMCSLAPGWTSTVLRHPRTMADPAWVFADLPNLTDMAVHFPSSHAHGSVEPHAMNLYLSVYAQTSLHTLLTTASFVRCLHGLRSALTCLTLDLVHAADLSVYTMISSVFGKTLRRLRIFRTFGVYFDRRSPARICAALSVEKLEYLEVRDVQSTGYTGPGTIDIVGENPLLSITAKAEVPNLSVMVWFPTWIAGYASNTAGFERTLDGYQCHLLAALEPINLLVCVGEKEATMFWSEDSGDSFRAPELVGIDGDKWREA